MFSVNRIWFLFQLNFEKIYLGKFIFFALKQLVNAEIPITYDGVFVRRNGKDYYVVKSVKAHANVSQMKLNTKCKNIPGIIQDQLNNLLNANWKVLKAEMDSSLNKYIGDIIRSILQPILNQVAVQDFYKN